MQHKLSNVKNSTLKQKSMRLTRITPRMKWPMRFQMFRMRSSRGLKRIRRMSRTYSRAMTMKGTLTSRKRQLYLSKISYGQLTCCQFMGEHSKRKTPIICR